MNERNQELPMIRHSRPILMIAAAISLLFVGCVEVNQTLIINGNGGTFEIVASISKDVADTVSKDSPYAIFFNTKTGAKHFNRPGLTVRNYRVYTNMKGDRTFIKVRGEVTDLEKALKSGVLGRFSLKKTKKGRRLECIVSDKKTVDGERVRKAFKGVSLKLAVSVPKSIHSTNGKRSGKTVSWSMDPADAKRETLYVEFE